MSVDIENRSQPTVVLVHGAFAESASWNGVIRQVQDQGYTAIAAANPLRSLSDDAEFVAGILGSIDGPIVLVGHSYGGSVISNAALGNENVEALVFVAAFAPEEGESIGELPREHPRRNPGDRPAFGWHHRPLHSSGGVPRAVRRRRAGRAGRAHGRDPASAQGRRAQRGLGAACVEGDTVVVPSPGPGQEHPA